MRARATALEGFYMGLVARLDCVICKRFERTGLPTEIHHVAGGSSVRSNFAIAPLCGSPQDGGHHRGSLGFHGMGDRAFCRLFRPPFESEAGLLVWTAEDLANYIKGRIRLDLPGVPRR